MPYIHLKTTESIDAARQEVLDRDLRRITQECLGKGENWVMTGYEPQAQLFFQGEDKQIAYVEVKCYGEPNGQGADRMTAQICTLLGQELGVPASRVYVSYFGTDKWGWSGRNL